MDSEKQRKTFLSYSRANKDFALKLAKELKSEGFDVWLDQLDIPLGARWDREVEKALRESEIFMIILTSASVDSENVLDEIGYAIDTHKRFLPILLEECEVPLRLRRFQYVDFTNKSFEDGVQAAKGLLRGLIAQQTVPRKAVVPEDQVETNQKAKEEAERKSRADAERKTKEEAERLAKAEAERKAKEEADSKAKADANRKAKEEAERLAKAEADRKAKEEADRLVKAEADRKSKEEADRLAKVEAERKEKEEAERLAKVESDRKAKEEAERLAKADADRKAREQVENRPAPEKQEEPVSPILLKKKPVFKWVVIGIGTVVLLCVAGVVIGFNILSNRTTPFAEATSISLSDTQPNTTTTPNPTPIPVTPKSDAYATFMNASDTKSFYEGENWANLYSLAFDQHTEDEINNFIDNSNWIPVALIESNPMGVTYGWCALNADILQDNLDHISFFFEFNGLPVSKKNIADVYFTSENGWECLRKVIAIEEWGAGEYRLGYGLTVNQKLNDGEYDYDVGDGERIYLIVTVP